MSDCEAEPLQHTRSLVQYSNTATLIKSNVIILSLTKEPAQKPMLCASATCKAWKGMECSAGAVTSATEHGVFCNYESITHLCSTWMFRFG